MKIFKASRSVTYSNMLRNSKQEKNFKFRYETSVLIREILKKNIEAESAWDAMKKKISVRNVNLEVLFARLDGDGRKFLTELNFKDHLQKQGMYAKPEEVRTIFQKFAQGEEGKMNVIQFITELTTTPMPKHIEELEQIIEDLKIQIDKEKEIVKLQDGIIKNKNFRVLQVFILFDKNTSGKITLKEFEKGLKKLNIKLDEKNLSILFQKFNKSDDGSLE
jgi:Ca2+-binding EF-hand superfamily protein